LNGEVYTQKPPLFYWLAALCGAPVGRVTETAARVPSAAAGLLTVATVCYLAA
jgi:4-amino-4-deoxy-L-arabinose transferase-like glycosyltransferase